MGPPSFAPNSQGLTEPKAPVNRDKSPPFARSASFLGNPGTFPHPSYRIKVLFRSLALELFVERNLFGPGCLRGTDTPDFLNVRFGQNLPVELTPQEASHPRLLWQAKRGLMRLLWLLYIWA